MSWRALTDRGITVQCLPNFDEYRALRSESRGGTTMAPLKPATRGTRWIQGTIIAASTMVIIFATVSLVGQSLKATDHTVLPAVPSAVLPEPTTAMADRPAPAEQSGPLVASPTVGAPPATTEATAVPVARNNQDELRRGGGQERSSMRTRIPPGLLPRSPGCAQVRVLNDT